MSNAATTANHLPVVKGVTYFLAHVPSMVRHGSKPSREVTHDPSLLGKLVDHLETFEEAVGYPPNQVFIGNLDPDDLHPIPTPWYKHPVPNASRQGPFGEIMPEEEFYGIMALCDEFDILLLETSFVEDVIRRLSTHPLVEPKDIEKLKKKGVPLERIEKAIETAGALPCHVRGNHLIGCCQRGHEEDFNLIPDILMENLANRASGVMALRHLTSKVVDAGKLEYLLGCGEEAVGDRYNRGGGNMAKAIGELAGCVRATGSDTKAFCCAPVHALILGASLVQARVFHDVAVVAGGSFAKLGMKFQGHLRSDMPVLEDVVAGIAISLGEDDGVSPVVRLDSVGKHEISSGSAQQAIFQKLVMEPLDRLGLKLKDIDKFATEMHNPEITEPQGSGNVPKANYRIIASFAVMRKEIEREQLEEFAKAKGMLGFSPTQGHIASAVPVLGHMVRKMKNGHMERGQLLAKGSLFLGRMTQLADGISFILEKNRGGKDGR